MSKEGSVRPSRDGDQFHYLWAARKCLGLLPGGSDLVAVAIEGASIEEVPGEPVAAGDQLIDVGLYFGDEAFIRARAVHYVQLKHSSRRASEAWTASGLHATIRGFAERFVARRKQFGAAEVVKRLSFAFTTNRPIAGDLVESVADLGAGTSPRWPTTAQKLLESSNLDGELAREFFGLLRLEGNEAGMWDQRNLLAHELGGYLPDADYDAPVQLKELVTRKATTDFARDPSIRRNDVLRALKTSEEALSPAPSLLPSPRETLPREQEAEILAMMLAAKWPLVVHADGGIGKSVLATRLASAVPRGSVAILYDCYGDGLYRHTLNSRHRACDGLVQIANELAAKGLCHPLIPTAHADAKAYLKAFLHRLKQAATIVCAQDPDAVVCVIVDAADNAEMAAREQHDVRSFARDLLHAPLPDGVRLVITCRSHRRDLLSPPLDAHQIELRPFSLAETGQVLHRAYPEATAEEVAEFAYLSTSNPRVQALAISQGTPLAEMLRSLGPDPTTAEAAIGELLDAALARLRERVGPLEESQIEAICAGLAALRPLVPISVLSTLAKVPVGAIRSFAYDLGRPLLVKGDSLHFMDEPAETWFRDRFRPQAAELAPFIDRLRPLAAHSAYVAAVLPQLLVEAGRLDEAVALALSTDGLPVDNPLERRDVELQRLTFALKASLKGRNYLAAAKLALKAGGETAGESRQTSLVESNTDLAAALMSTDRVEEIVSRRTFGSGWMGSRHAYDAGLLSASDALQSEAASRLRMALSWLESWSKLSPEARESERIGDDDRAELCLAMLRLRGGRAAAHFLRRWRPRHLAFPAASQVGERLIDLGLFDQLDAVAAGARNDLWVILALARELRRVGRMLPAPVLTRVLRLLADDRARLKPDEGFEQDWRLIDGVAAVVEMAARAGVPHAVLMGVIRRYLPTDPPRDLTSRYGVARGGMLRPYALLAALEERRLTLEELSPPAIREEITKAASYGRSREADEFRQDVGAMLPWFQLHADVMVGRVLPNDFPDAVAEARRVSRAARQHAYQDHAGVMDTIAKTWLRAVLDVGGDLANALAEFRAWIEDLRQPLSLDTRTAIVRRLARTPDQVALAMDLAAAAFETLEGVREDAESRSNWYIDLARAIFAVSPSEARAYFDRAVEIASRIGDENLDRWSALLNLARAAADPAHPRPSTAYLLSRVAELTYEFVARDKHFDWRRTVRALTDLCPSSAFAIMSRWRDRDFGYSPRLLPIAVYHLRRAGRLSSALPVALAGIDAEWDRVEDLERFLADSSDAASRAIGTATAYRYLRVSSGDVAHWTALEQLRDRYGLYMPDLDRLLNEAQREAAASKPKQEASVAKAVAERPGRQDFDELFREVDTTRAEHLSLAYRTLRSLEPPFEIDQFFREACRRTPAGREAEFLRAVAQVPEFGVYTADYVLRARPAHWSNRQGARSALRDLVLESCRRDPPRVHRYGWYESLPFRQLVTEGVLTQEQVADACLDGAYEEVGTYAAGELFHLIEALSDKLKPDEADEALCFGIGLLDDAMRPADGDGDWRPSLAPPESLSASIAGYIWAGLASPRRADRWEFAHAVRGLVEVGVSPVLEKLASLAAAGDGGPFQDQGLTFYLWHARLWLALGLARGASTNPAALDPFFGVLKAWVSHDHVLLRDLAARALERLVQAAPEREDGLPELAGVNASPFPPEVTRYGEERADEPSDDEGDLTGEAKYYFGIDITPYWFSPLGRAFGLSEKAIERRVRRVLRRDFGWAGGSWRDDARQTRGVYRDNETHHSHGSLPRTDDLTSYHAFNGMMIVAGQLLRDRQVRQYQNEERDEFADWLDGHQLVDPHGRWAADRRDPRLVLESPRPDSYNDETWRWRVSRADLETQLHTDDGWISVWGWWSSGDSEVGENVDIRSAVVSRIGAEALVAALQTAADLGEFHLPSGDAQHDDEDRFHKAPLRLSGWVASEAVEHLRDERDPWSEGLRCPGPRPAPAVVDRLALKACDAGRTWRLAGEEAAAFRSEAWTRVSGMGRESETVPGQRLSVSPTGLQTLLGEDERLIVSVEMRRRHRDKPAWRSDDESLGYPQPYKLYFLLGPDCAPRTL